MAIEKNKVAGWRAIAESLYPKSRIRELTPYFDEMLNYGGINNDERFSMFLAQTAYESQYFTRFEENLNYSASNLELVWPSRFRPPKTNAEKTLTIFADGKRNSQYYANKPKEIGNIVYANRYGNDGITSGEGWKFSGKGLIMLTFKDNYKNFTEKNGIFTEDFVKNPELLTRPRYALGSAAFFWGSNKLNTPSDQKDVAKVTRIISGTDRTVTQRKALFDKIYKLVKA